MSFVAVAVVGSTALATGIAAATAPDAPDAPDYGKATRDGYLADIETLPMRKQIEAAAKLGKSVLKEGYTKKSVSSNAGVTTAQSRVDELTKNLSTIPQTVEKTTPGPQGRPNKTTIPNPDYENLLAQLKTAQTDLNDAVKNAGTEGAQTLVYYDKDGNPVSAKDAILADFAGYSDIDQSRANLDFQLESADKTAGAALDIQKKYGPEYIAQRLKELELADPVGTQLRKDLGKSVSDDLAEGYNLPAGLEEQVTQAERGAQAARGNIYGAAPGAAEALKVGDAAIRLKQQRQANVASFLAGQTPTAQFSSISGAQQGAAGFAPQNITPGLSVNQNAGAQGASFAAQTYGTESSNALNSPNPWGSLLGAISGIGVGAASSALGSYLKPKTA